MARAIRQRAVAPSGRFHRQPACRWWAGDRARSRPRGRGVRTHFAKLRMANPL